MNFRNLTGLGSLTFFARDHEDTEYHVVVIGCTRDIKDESDEEPDDGGGFMVTDRYFDKPNTGSVRRESDLAPFKPLCDIIVNATAYAPGGIPASRFSAGVKITRPAHMNGPGGTVLHKTLVITGPRAWKEGDTGWQLTEPETIESLPVRYEYAYGGENRIEQNDPFLEKLDEKGLLTPEQIALHPDGPDHAPAAHAVCTTNPVGIGYLEAWYRNALAEHSDGPAMPSQGTTTGGRLFAAPQIESPDDPIVEFGKHYEPQGFGVIGKSWEQRRRLAGTYDEEWLKDLWPGLPCDFDFLYWNGAHPDMQVPYLSGDEMIELTNLSPDGHLTFTLPGQIPYVLVRYETGDIAPVPAHLDTVVIEPDDMKVNLVWRAVVPAEPEVRVLEARLTTKEVIDEMLGKLGKVVANA